MGKRTKKLKNKFSITKYLPVFIILVSITIILGSTFAYFTDRMDKESSLTFSKVELSSETTVGINGRLKDVIPGTPLTNGSVSFSKAIDSQALYVRAKVSFSLPSEYKNDTAMQGLLESLRNATDFNVITTEQHGAVWSAKDGNYFYLMENVNGTTPTLLKRVDTIDTYTLAEEIVVPRDLKQLDGNAQYMKSINFHIAFEAIQADNMSNQLSVMKETFNTIFPELEDEKMLNQPEPVITHSVTVFGKDLTINSTIDAEDNKIMTEPEIELESNEVVVGWYEDAAFENAFNFNEPITSNVSLYPKVLEATNPSEFTISDGVITKYNGSETSIVLPRYYKVDKIEELSNTYASYTLLNSEISKIRSGSSTVGWSFPVTITDPEGNDYTINDYYNDYYPIRTTLQAMTGTFTISASNITYTYGEKGDLEIVGLGYALFRDNTSITEVVIPKGITHIESYVFAGCTALTKVEFSTITYFEGGTFKDCTNLTDVVFASDSTFTSIESNTFQNCRSLNNLIIPNSVEEIGYYAFSGCINLTNLTLSRNIKLVYDSFANCGYYNTTSNWVNNMLTIPLGDTDNMALLAAKTNISGVVTIPSGVKVIASAAFAGCVNITKVILPDSLISICSNAFQGCTSLNNVEIPNSVRYLGYYSFGECSNLREIKLPEELDYLGDVIIKNTAYYNNSSNWVNGALYLPLGDSGYKALIEVKTSVSGAFVMPNDVKYIAESAIDTCTNITSLTLSNNLKYIGCYPFRWSSSIKSLTIPKSVKVIDELAFAILTSLECVIFEDGSDIEIFRKLYYDVTKPSYILMEESLVDNFMVNNSEYSNLVYTLQETGYSGLTETEVVIDSTLTLYTATDSDGNEWVRTTDNKYYKKMI